MTDDIPSTMFYQVVSKDDFKTNSIDCKWMETITGRIWSPSSSMISSMTL